MTRTAKVMRNVALTMVALFAVGGGTFVIGEVFTDPGGWQAVAMTASWVVPVVVLGVVALRRPDAAGAVLMGVTALAVVFTVLDAAVGIVPRDGWGPVATVAVFAVVVVLGLLGVHRAELAGLLMLGVGAGQLVATLIARGGAEAGEGPGPGALLGGSSGVVVLPTLVIGLLLVLAGAFARESDQGSHRADRGHSHPAARAT